MGATKLNIKHVTSIAAEDLNINGFQLSNEKLCTYTVNRPLEQGEMVLIKASFKNPCESEAEEEEVVLYRRRVVPFVTRVMRISAKNGVNQVKIAAKIESITDEDRRFFFKKYLETSSQETPTELEIEGKQIRFAVA